MIKILYFGRTQNDTIWEYDFIQNEILKDFEIENCEFIQSLKELKNIQKEFDVLVYSCRDPNNYPWGYMPTYQDILECVNLTSPKIIIQLSDEFDFENLQEHNQLGRYCELFLRQHHFSNYEYTSNTIQMPLGYGTGCKFPESVLPISERYYSWSHAGEVKTDRYEMLNQFQKIYPHWQVCGMSKIDMINLYNNSIFVPCGRGNSSLNCFRLYEASICGAIPVVVGSKEEIECTFKYEKNPPWLFFETWEEASNECLKLLEDKENLQEIQYNILLWWETRINKVRDKVKDALVTNIIKNKLKNFPPINFISIEESEDRRKVLYDSFEKYKLSNITPHIYKRYNDLDHQISGEECDIIIPKQHRGPVTSHLKAVKEWYENTDEDYAFFCEDDLSFETVRYWSFTWTKFLNKLPENWECVQLCFISTHNDYTDERLSNLDSIFRYRDWCDWSACAYLIKRSQAKNIVENYFNGDEIILKYKGLDYDGRKNSDPRWLIPSPESMVYSYFKENSIYFIPLFLESINFNSTWVTDEVQNSFHTYSNISVLNWWKTVGKNLKLDAIIP